MLAATAAMRGVQKLGQEARGLVAPRVGELQAGRATLAPWPAKAPIYGVAAWKQPISRRSAAFEEAPSLAGAPP